MFNNQKTKVMVKKSTFNGVVRIEFENGKTTNVACLTMQDVVIEVRHDAENKDARHTFVDCDALSVRAGERLVLVMSESFAKRGELDECELSEVWKLYRKARRHSEDRLRVRIYATDEVSAPSALVGYAWIGEGKGIAEPDATEEDTTEEDATEEDNDALSDLGFIGITLIVPTKGYSNESKADEPKTSNVSVAGVGYTIDAVITYTNPKVSAQTIIDTTDCLRHKLSDIITAWEN